MNECTKKYIKNLPYYRKYTPAVIHDWKEQFGYIKFYK